MLPAQPIMGSLHAVDLVTATGRYTAVACASFCRCCCCCCFYCVGADGSLPEGQQVPPDHRAVQAGHGGRQRHRPDASGRADTGEVTGPHEGLDSATVRLSSCLIRPLGILGPCCIPQPCWTHSQDPVCVCVAPVAQCRVASLPLSTPVSSSLHASSSRSPPAQRNSVAASWQHHPSSSSSRQQASARLGPSGAVERWTGCWKT